MVLYSNSEGAPTSPHTSKTTRKSNPMIQPERGEKRRVAFDLDKNEVHSVAFGDDMTAEEIEATWYNCFELSDIKAEIRRIVRMMKEGIPENDKLTFRGLEIRGKHRGERRRQRQEKMLKVLGSIQFHGRLGGGESERLAEAMRSCTAESRKEALEIAKRDAQAALKSLGGKRGMRVEGVDASVILMKRTGESSLRLNLLSRLRSTRR